MRTIDHETEETAFLLALGERIRAKRKELERSGRWLARKAGISVTYTWEIEGGRASPSLIIVSRIAKALGCSIDELAGTK